MLSIVVLNWNAWEQTLKCLGVLGHSRGEFHVVIVENGSRDGSREKLERGLENLSGNQKAFHLVVSESNRGFAGGCNLGIKRSLELGASHIFLLNNDAWPDSPEFAKLMDVIESHPKALIGCLTLNAETGREEFTGASWPGVLFGNAKFATPEPRPEVWESGYLEGSALILPKDFCETAIQERDGVFDESLFLYCEDVDLALYAKSKGFRCLMTSAFPIRHMGSHSSSGNLRPLPFYYITRNRIQLANRWLGLPYRLAFHLYYLPSRFLLAVWRLLRNRSGSSFKILQAVSDGLVDGYRNVRGKWKRHLG